MPRKSFQRLVSQRAIHNYFAIDMYHNSALCEKSVFSLLKFDNFQIRRHCGVKHIISGGSYVSQVGYSADRLQ